MRPRRILDSSLTSRRLNYPISHVNPAMNLPWRDGLVQMRRSLPRERKPPHSILVDWLPEFPHGEVCPGIDIEVEVILIRRLYIQNWVGWSAGERDVGIDQEGDSRLKRRLLNPFWASCSSCPIGVARGRIGRGRDVDQ